MNGIDDFKEFILDQIVNIDATLSSDSVPPSKRVLMAARIFSETYINSIDDKSGRTEISEIDISDYFAEEWFAVVYFHCHEWYLTRYERNQIHPPKNFVTGCIWVDGSPYLIRPPLYSTKAEIEGETTWMTFLGRVLDSEQPQEWIVDAPKFIRDSKRSLLEVEVSTKTMAEKLRKATLKIQCADIQEKPDALKATPIANLEKAAQSLVNGSPIAIGTAMWELQLAAEGFLKLLIFQLSTKWPHGHNLNTLFDQLSTYKTSSQIARLKGFPDWQTVGKMRYGEIPPPNKKDVFNHYQSVVTFCAHIAYNYNGPNLDGTRILLKRAPYTRFEK